MKNKDDDRPVGASTPDWKKAHDSWIRRTDFIARMRELDGTVDSARFCDWLRSCGLLKELQELASIRIARPAVKVTQANFMEGYVRTPAGYVLVPVLHELGQNQYFFGRRWPQRSPTDRECCRCQLYGRSSQLSLDGGLTLCRACEIELGFGLESWPSCDECGHPFPTATAGEAGQGRWADPIAPDETLCGPCWLEAEYHAHTHDRTRPSMRDERMRGDGDR